MKGKVYIVGAGPGDPELISLKGAKALMAADVVLYDRLVNEEILKLAPQATHIYAGKELGIDSQSRQDAIHQELIRYAHEGRIVVRLKGGDPFVFGRGGEEALALAEAGIDFEIIPGISSSIAAPARANIPVTHRAVSPAFAVFAAQTEKGSLSEELWQAAALIPTAVFLMGVEKLPLIVQKLQKFGRARDAPIALISSGTLQNERVVEGTLEDILDKSKGVFPPCTIIVGPCVRIRSQIQQAILQAENKQARAHYRAARKPSKASRHQTEPIFQTLPNAAQPRQDTRHKTQDI